MVYFEDGHHPDGGGMGIGANIVSQVTAWRIALINYVICWPWLGGQVVKGISHTSEYGPDDLRLNPGVFFSGEKCLTYPDKRHFKNFKNLELWGKVKLQSFKASILFFHLMLRPGFEPISVELHWRTLNRMIFRAVHWLKASRPNRTLLNHT